MPGIASRRGRLFLDNHPAPGRELQCTDCWAETLRMLLCQGWDVHNHRFDDPCDRSCATRTKGRKYQLSVMREAAVDRKRNFLLTKQMDGLRGVNGSLQLQALRMVRFLSQIPQFWYEPVRSVDELLAHLELAASLEKSGVAELA